MIYFRLLGTGEPESSPLKGYLPKLIKRSASIDTSGQDSSPPSDPWKFLSDIKVYSKVTQKLSYLPVFLSLRVKLQKASKTN